MSKYLMGGLVDERTPDIDDLLKGFPTLNADEFKEWLGSRLGYYRFFREHQPPTLSMEKTELKQYIKALKSIEPYFKSPSNLPPIARSILFEVEYKFEVTHEYGLRGNTRGLYKLILRKRRLAEQALATLNERHPSSKKGRKSKNDRNRLFSEIAKKLCSAGVTITTAREAASEILIRAGLEMPDDERTVRRVHANGGH